MRDREMRVGEAWAYRERPHALDCPVFKAEILEVDPSRRGRVRVRLHGGEFRGRESWVPKVRLRARWEEKEAWLRDERALAAARKASEGAEGTAVCQAADIVFAAYRRPDGILLDWPSGAGTVCMFEPVAVAADLGVEVDTLLSLPLAFIDRSGVYYAPASLAEGLARLVASRYPEEVLAGVAKEERQLGDEQGETIDEGPRFTGQQLVFELVRDWCGREAVERFDRLAWLPTEVKRLRKLVIQAADALEEAERPEIAAELREQVQGKEPVSHPEPVPPETVEEPEEPTPLHPPKPERRFPERRG